jgi:hypothetical protein
MVTRVGASAPPKHTPPLWLIIFSPRGSPDALQGHLQPAHLQARRPRPLPQLDRPAARKAADGHEPDLSLLPGLHGRPNRRLGRLNVLCRQVQAAISGQGEDAVHSLHQRD